MHAQPLPLSGVVAALEPGDPVGGDLAVVRSGGVHVIVTSRRKPYHFVSELLKLGLDPEQHNITVVKIGYLEPDLRRMARHALLALTPGAVNQDIPSLTYRRVVRPVYPLDTEFDATPFAAQLFGA